MFKIITGQGLSVFVLALFRNLVLLACSLATAFYLRKGPFQSSGMGSLDPNYFSRISLQLRNPQFLLAQARSFFGTASFLLFTFNLQLIPITLIIIFFQTNPLWSAILGYLINGEKVQ